jgi:hypothetical protein
VYVVLRLTVGGEICGYWAIGKERRDKAPKMTMIMEMTMAKIGRRIKKLDMTRLLI